MYESAQTNADRRAERHPVIAVKLAEPNVVAAGLQLRRDAPTAIIDRENVVVGCVGNEGTWFGLRRAVNDERGNRACSDCAEFLAQRAQSAAAFPMALAAPLRLCARTNSSRSDGPDGPMTELAFVLRYTMHMTNFCPESVQPKLMS